MRGTGNLAGLACSFALGIRLQARRRDRFSDQLTTETGGLATTSYARRRVIAERLQAAESALRERFPEEERLLPTALGNVLRAAEERVGRRYGIDTVVLWPRLFPLLPPEHARDVDDEVMQLDLSARLVTTWTAASLSVLGVLVANPHALARHFGWLAVPALLAVLARLAYRAAIESALAHASDLEVALDLYRTRVPDAMRMQRTRTLREDRAQFARLCGLLTTYDKDHRINFPLTRHDAGGEPVADAIRG